MKLFDQHLIESLKLLFRHSVTCSEVTIKRTLNHELYCLVDYYSAHQK